MESRAEDRAVEISLQPYQGSQHDGPGAQGAEAAFQSLKPVDTGRDAWTVLVAGIAFEALFWGFPMCFGVFQDYYSGLPELKGDTTNIPMIGTLAQGLYYLGAPLSPPS